MSQEDNGASPLFHWKLRDLGVGGGGGGGDGDIFKLQACQVANFL